MRIVYRKSLLRYSLALFTTCLLQPCGNSSAQQRIIQNFNSILSEDGYVAGSADGARKAVHHRASVNDSLAGLFIGDTAANTSYRSIISFDTSALPDNVIVTDARLLLTRSDSNGGNPFKSGFGHAQLDLAAPYFGASSALEGGDFNSVATLERVGSFSDPGRAGKRFAVVLGAGAMATLNARRHVQLRMYFDVPTNDDNKINVAQFFSGDAAAAKRPVLQLTYVVSGIATPSPVPSTEPTVIPTSEPTSLPTTLPSIAPTLMPTTPPTNAPSIVPTTAPTVRVTPTERASATATIRPTAVPTLVSTPRPTSTPAPQPTGSPAAWQPHPGTSWQWQLTGTIDTSLNVQMYDIDLFDAPQSTINALKQSGKIVICYFSAGSYENWRPDAANFPSAVLGSSNGWPGEKWLDIRNIAQLGPVLAARLDLAKQKNCDGVEPDNVDGYTNKTGFPLSSSDQLTFNRWIANQAHQRGLSVGLKNDLSQVAQLVANFDWALNEQCNQYSECNLLLPFVQANKAAFGVEYEGSTSSFCPVMNALNMDWLKKDLDLDAARVSCR